MSSKTLIPFSYFGSKASSMKWLEPLLPYTNHFVDVCGGSGVVGLNIKPRPIMTYNDINGDVVNFFRVLRNQPDELIRLIELTPYSREEYLDAWPVYSELDLERAYRFYIRADFSKHFLGAQYESRDCFRFERSEVRTGAKVASGVSKVLSHQRNLYKIAGTIKNWQIECLTAIEMIQLCNHVDILQYLDLPYLHTTRTGSNDYKFEMTEAEHIDIAAAVNDKGMLAKVAISGYMSDLYKELYKGWHLSVAKERRGRQECLWTNYNPDTRTTLF